MLDVELDQTGRGGERESCVGRLTKTVVPRLTPLCDEMGPVLNTGAQFAI